MNNWNDENTTSLIEMYRERPGLWDLTDGNYKNRNKRHEELMEIADFFAIEKIDVEKKIKSLQTQFSRERKRIESEEGYSSKWFAYKMMMFLDKNKSRNTRDAERHNEEESSSEDSGEQQTEVSNITATAVYGPTTVKKSKVEPSGVADKRIDEVYAFFKQAAGAPKVVKDEIHVFCELLALKLRALDENKRDEAMHEINNMMYDLKSSSSSRSTTRNGSKKRNGSLQSGSRALSSMTSSGIEISELE